MIKLRSLLLLCCGYFARSAIFTAPPFRICVHHHLSVWYELGELEIVGNKLNYPEGVCQGGIEGSEHIMYIDPRIYKEFSITFTIIGGTHCGVIDNCICHSPYYSTSMHVEHDCEECIFTCGHWQEPVVSAVVHLVEYPTLSPTHKPTTKHPTKLPSFAPTKKTKHHEVIPTHSPTPKTKQKHTSKPTSASAPPTKHHTSGPTKLKTTESQLPTVEPTLEPTLELPAIEPTIVPTDEVAVDQGGDEDITPFPVSDPIPTPISVPSDSLPTITNNTEGFLLQDPSLPAVGSTSTATEGGTVDGTSSAGAGENEEEGEDSQTDTDAGATDNNSGDTDTANTGTDTTDTTDTSNTDTTDTHDTDTTDTHDADTADTNDTNATDTNDGGGSTDITNRVRSIQWARSLYGLIGAAILLLFIVFGMLVFMQTYQAIHRFRTRAGYTEVASTEEVEGNRENTKKVPTL